MSAAPPRWRCDACGHISIDGELLEAPHPFQPGGIVLGCPGCRGIGTDLERVCDVPGCSRVVACGTPTPTGYRSTCSEHAPHA